MSHVVFVYGTLKSGYGNNHLLSPKSQSLGEAVTVGKHFNMWCNRAFPMVARDKHARGGSPVGGEAYRVDDATLSSLDRLEGCPYLYQRERVKVRLDSGRVCMAWMYLIRDVRRACAFDKVELKSTFLWWNAPPKREEGWGYLRSTERNYR